MSPIIIELALAGLSALVGLAAGWFLRGETRDRADRDAAPAEPQIATPNTVAVSENGCVSKARNGSVDGSVDGSHSTAAAKPLTPDSPTASAPIQEITPLGSEKRSVATDNSRLAAVDSANAKKLEARATAILDELQEVAVGMSAHVGDHSHCVQQINDELEAGDTSEPGPVMEAMAKLVEANKRMQKQLAAAEKKLERQSHEIAMASAEAMTDPLTQLANRRAFDRTMQRSLMELQERGRPVSLMLLDVDRFKLFNDTHGHNTGDEVLKGVADVLKRRFRGAELAARYGGEEFAVIFPGDALGDARASAEFARRAVGEARYAIDGVELRVTASAGLAEARPGEDAESLVKRADDALYASKHAGRNCGHWHDGQSLHRLSIEGVADPNETAEPADAKAAHLDPLTGLSTPTHFVEDLTRRLAEAKRYDASLSVIVLQLDGHDQCIDKRGVKTASLIVKTVAQFLRAAMRDMDHVSRYNDDTFALLLPSADLTDAVKAAERLRQAIARCSLGSESDPIHFTVCVGVAQAERSDETLKVLRRAQWALGMARNRGTNLTCLHDGRECRLAAPVEPAKALK